MSDFTWLLGIVGPVAAIAALAWWQLRWRRVRDHRRRVKPLRDEVFAVLPQLAGNSGVERFALLYLQVDALLVEGAERLGIETKKIGGLFSTPVGVDSWTLARALFLEEYISLRTYVHYTVCRRVWNRLLAGRQSSVRPAQLRRCEGLVDRLNHQLGVPVAAVRERVTARLAAAGVPVGG